jgi:hypothetical protein
MAETTIAPTQAVKRFDIKRAFVFLRHPQAQFGQLFSEGKSAWQMPMLVLSATLLLSLVVSGYYQARAAAMSGISLPPDAQWWTPEMQNNYMTAMQQTKGPVFVYVIPAVMGLASLWLGWVVMSGLFHLTSTLFGGRGNVGAALNIVAWAGLSFAIRDLLRVVFMLVAGHTIASPGLSGFVTGSESGSLFLAQLLKHIDLFLVWYAVLAVIGFSMAESLPNGKAAAGVLIVLAISVLAQAGLGTLGASLASLLVTRPF